MSHFYALLFNSQFFQYDWFWAFLIQLLYGLSEANSVLASIYWCQVGAKNTVCYAKVSHLLLPITHSSTTIICLETICLVYISYYRKLWFPNSSMYLIFGQLLSPPAFSTGFSEMQTLNIPFTVCFNRNLSPPRHLLPLQSFQMSHIIGLGGKVVFFSVFHWLFQTILPP